MKPMMNSLIKYKATSGTDDYDEFGNPISSNQETMARVRESTKTSVGTNKFVTAWYYEIDVMAHVVLQKGDSIIFDDPITKESKEVIVETGTTNLNISGRRIEYRTYIAQAR